jgi:hypothetical protein
VTRVIATVEETIYSGRMVRSSGVVVGVALATVLAGCNSSPSGQHGDAAGAAGASGAAGADGGPAGAGAAGTSAAGGSTGGASGATATTDPSTPDGFCLGYYKLVADLLVRCDGLSAAGADMLLGDPVFCARFDASIAAGRESFDGTHGRACLDELATALTCGGSTPSMPTQAPDCTVTMPRVPLGGTCRSFDATFIGQECMGDSYCKSGPNEACDGTCTAFATLGQPCDLLNDVRCTQTLTCDSAMKKCVMPPPAAGAGATCDAQTSCARGFYCDHGADGGASGTCQAQKTSGPCATTDACKLPYRCAGPAGATVCAAPKPVGDACTPGQSECDLFGYCGPGSKCTDTYVAVGQPCGRIGGENYACASGEYCDGPVLQGGTCRAQKQPGEACTGAVLFECAGNNGHCDATSHKCVACPF